MIGLISISLLIILVRFMIDLPKSGKSYQPNGTYCSDYTTKFENDCNECRAKSGVFSVEKVGWNSVIVKCL